MGAAHDRVHEREPEHSPGYRPERSIGAMVRDIGGNIDRIVRAELRFAVAELRAGFEAAGEAAVFILAGIACATLASAFLLLAVMHALALVMPTWAAALVVAAGVGIAAAALIAIGRDRIPKQAPHPSSEIVTIPGPVP